MEYRKLLAAGGALALAACSQQQKSESTTLTAPASESAQTYSGTGKVTAIAGNQVSIAHGPIAGIGWPAMTMTFTVSAGVPVTVGVGDQVAFSFRQEGAAFPLTSLKKR